MPLFDLGAQHSDSFRDLFSGNSRCVPLNKVARETSRMIESAESGAKRGKPAALLISAYLRPDPYIPTKGYVLLTEA